MPSNSRSAMQVLTVVWAMRRLYGVIECDAHQRDRHHIQRHERIYFIDSLTMNAIMSEMLLLKRVRLRNICLHDNQKLCGVLMGFY